jgi:hypothetical protein
MSVQRTPNSPTTRRFAARRLAQRLYRYWAGLLCFGREKFGYFGTN